MATTASQDQIKLNTTRATRKVARTAVTEDVKATSDQFQAVDSENLEDAQVMLRRLQRLSDELPPLDDYILAFGTDASKLDEEVETASGYSAKLNDAIDRLKLRIAALQNNGSRRSSSTSEAQMTKIKTPKLELTTFSGDPLKWEEFWDDFSCSIDSRDDLSTIDKFKILKQSLRGEAFSVANGYHLTQNNYQEVKDALKDRFGDPQVAIFAHFEALIELKTATHDVSQLVKIRDQCEAHIRSLSALGLTEDTFGQVFAPILLSKLPRYVKLELHRRNGSNKWTLTALREHLKEEIRARTKSDRYMTGASAEGGKDEPHSSKERGSGGRRRSQPTSAALLSPSKSKDNQSKSMSCAFCDQMHRSWECKKYPTAERRIERVKGRCFVCLSSQHMKKDCGFHSRQCYYCKRVGHHSSLCYQQFGQRRSNQVNMVQALNLEAPSFEPSSRDVSALANAQGKRQGIAILETGLVRIKGKACSVMARVVFDNGSTISFIRTSLAKQVEAPRAGKTVTSLGKVGDKVGIDSRYNVVQTLLCMKNGNWMPANLHTIESVAPPQHRVPFDLGEVEDVLDQEDLADIVVKEPVDAQIDILFGLDYYYVVVGMTEWRCKNGLVVKDTVFGKILTGFIPTEEESTNDHQMLVPDISSVGADLERFWRIEDIGIHDKPCQNDDEVALDHFNRTAVREDGRYSVQWPFKLSPPELPDNYELALRRLVANHSRLSKDDKLLEFYAKNFADQKARKVIEVVPKKPDGVVHHLPHHTVITPSKETTKVRVVFDASAKPRKSDQSLNDSMHRGPVFLKDLCGLLLRFRLKPTAVTSDVEKAFLQISLQPKHRDCTRFLWLKEPRKPVTKENIVVYRYARIPFGVKASPFLLAASIEHHLRLVDTPTANLVSENIYMDNVVVGVDSHKEATGYYTEAKSLFWEAKMNLREWYSNDSEFIAALPQADQGKSPEPSVLGVKWLTKSDTIRCRTKVDCDSVVTKRSMLETVASVFDPCGWFSPVMVRGKVLLQDLWKAKVGWDDKVPKDVLRGWREVTTDIEAVGSHSLPRMVSSPNLGKPGTRAELHVFGDASSRAYAACVYLRVTSHGHTRCDLLFSKARVAPVKALTIPRLELMAAVIGVRLLKFVSDEIKVPIHSKTLWSDSRCVLSWLNSEKVTTTFVENRLKEIRKAEGVEYRYVTTKENPADMPSRGVCFADLQSNKMWWTGPEWLSKPKVFWPTVQKGCEMTVSESGEMVALVKSDAVPEPENLFDLSRFSSLYRLMRCTGFLLKAVRRFKRQDNAENELSGADIQQAREFWERRIQGQYFTDEWFESRRGKNMTSQLGLFKDGQGMVRCRGRYCNSSSLQDQTKCPILLPASSEFTDLVVKQCHSRVLHSGLKHTVAEMRQRYWVPRSRATIKAVLRDCRLCRRYQGKAFRYPDQAPLPDFRSSIQRPFSCVGLDYVGPLYVKPSSYSGDSEPKKVWVALFTCAVVRAVHLEVVSTMSAMDFMLALRRFMAIYGTPRLVVSDNAKHFKQSSQMLSKV